MNLPPVRDVAAVAYAAVRARRGHGSLGERVDALSALQAARNVLDACEVELLGQVAAIELVSLEDGTEDVRHHVIGHQEMDAPEIVAPCLGISVHAAAARLSTATALLTRTPALVTEMVEGRLDGYRAGVVSDELDDASVATAEAVVAELIARADAAGGWVQSAGPLRRRAASTLARIDASLAQARRERERARRGLTRRVESSALDRWDGVYPIEQARLAWEAVDVRAREILRAGQADTLAQARADAHLQLLLAQVTATIHLHPTVPAKALVAGGVQPGLAGAADMATSERLGGEAQTERLGGLARTECFGGVAQTERLGGVAPTDHRGDAEIRGFGGAQSVQVDRDWLTQALADGRAVVAAPVTCDPVTGAALVAPEGLTNARRPRRLDGVTGTTGVTGTPAATEDQYRPSNALRALIELRDGTCRFPGCHIAAKFCDLDHVRPWPDGPTSAENLMALCRRHHRLKQRPAWRVALAANGVATWRYPDGRVRTTDPVDHLDTTRPLLTTPVPIIPGTTAPVVASGPVAAGPAIRRKRRAIEDLEPYGIRDHSPLVEHYCRLLRDRGHSDAVALASRRGDSRDRCGHGRDRQGVGAQDGWPRGEDGTNVHGPGPRATYDEPPF
jgi:hypothetical protein